MERPEDTGLSVSGQHESALLVLVIQKPLLVSTPESACRSFMVVHDVETHLACVLFVRRHNP